MPAAVQTAVLHRPLDKNAPQEPILCGISDAELEGITSVTSLSALYWHTGQITDLKYLLPSVACRHQTQHVSQVLTQV